MKKLQELKDELRHCDEEIVRLRNKFLRAKGSIDRAFTRNDLSRAVKFKRKLAKKIQELENNK